MRKWKKVALIALVVIAILALVVITVQAADIGLTCRKVCIPHRWAGFTWFRCFQYCN